MYSSILFVCQVRETDLRPAFIHDKRLTLHTHGSTKQSILLLYKHKHMLKIVKITE